MNNNKFINGILLTLETILTITQTNEIFQTISIILTCLSAAVVLAFNVWKWWKAAKKDGKIDKEEIEELADIVKDGVEDIKEKTDGNNN